MPRNQTVYGKMKGLLLVVGVVVAFALFMLSELLIDAWREIDRLKKEIDHLKRQGVTPRKFEKNDD